MNPISIVPNLTNGAIALGVVLAIVGAAFVAGDVRGSHQAELACEKAKTQANAAAIDQWLAAKSTQDDRDAERRKADADASKAAADRALAVADRFERMRIAVIKQAPRGDCNLSPEWVRSFNDAK